MAEPFRFGLVEDERVQLARRIRAGFEMLRHNLDSIARDRLLVELTRSYIVAELIELEARYTQTRVGFVKKAESLIWRTRGLVHLTLEENFAGEQRRTLLSRDLAKFLGISGKQVRSQKNVTPLFVEKYMPDDDFPDAWKDFHCQQKEFYKLVKTKVDRLPNFLFTIKDKKGYSSLIGYTYAVYLKDYEFLGVLYISQRVEEGIEVTEYARRIKNKEIIFPHPNQIKLLKELVGNDKDNEERVRRDRDYLLKLREINDKVDRLLCRNVGSDAKENVAGDARRVHQFLSDVEDIDRECVGRPHAFIDKLKRMVSEAAFCVPTRDGQGESYVYAYLKKGDPAQTVLASSRKWLEFWEVSEKDVINKSVWDYYTKTYHELRLNSAGEDNAEVYEHIARQQRQSIKAMHILDPYPLTMFIKRKAGDCWKLYGRLVYVHPGEINDYPLMLFLIQAEQVREGAVSHQEQANVLAERDSLSGFVASYHISAVAYEVVFKLMSLDVSSTWLEDARNVIWKSAKGEVCLEHMRVSKKSTWINNGMAQKFEVDGVSTYGSLREICTRYFETRGVDMREFDDQYINICALAMENIGVRRLPNICLAFDDPNHKNSYVFATFYALAAYDRNGDFRGVVYVYNEEKYTDEHTRGKRLEGFKNLNYIIQKSLFPIDWRRNRRGLLEMSVDRMDKANMFSIWRNTTDIFEFLRRSRMTDSSEFLYSDELTIAEFKEQVRNVTSQAESYKLLAALKKTEEIREVVEEQIKEMFDLQDKVEGRIGYMKTSKSVGSRDYSSDVFRYTDKDGERKTKTVQKPSKPTRVR